MELRFPGLAPTPDQLSKIMKAAQEEAESDEGGVPEFEIRTEDYPGGTTMNVTPNLRNEVTQLIYSTHWEYQKRVLDQIESVIPSDRQWAIVRRILMGIMTEQVERTRLLVGQRIRQEMFKTEEPIEEKKNV